MESYRIIKNELKKLNIKDFDGISEKVLSKLITDRFKKDNQKNKALFISITILSLLLFYLIGKRIWKR